MEEKDRPFVDKPERLELETVAASLQRTPKMENLLRYLAQRYFAGEIDELTEYNIATEVFGRRKTDFIASEDSIARVQTHRLRKRLKEYYENEGRDHQVRISIPPGSYAPVFTRQEIKAESLLERSQPATTTGEAKLADLAQPPVAASEPGVSSPDPIGSEHQGALLQPTSSGNRGRVLAFSGTIIALAILALGIAFARRGDLSSLIAGLGSAVASKPSASTSHPGSASTSATGAAIPLRIIAGYSGPPETDSAGNVWESDRYFRNGWTAKQPLIYIARTSDPLIFRYGRSGDCDYDIPLKPGTYELHLYFNQASQALQAEDLENKAIFNLAVNGNLALEGFDIVSDAMGRNVADERVFRDITPASDGKLHLHISTVVGTPSLSAIEIVPGTPHKQIPIRLVTQPTPYTDRNGQTWHPDTYFWSGRYLVHNLPSVGASDLDLPPSERYGHFSYAIPVDPRDRYTLVLHFSELFFGGEEPGGAGKRVFRVLCNGTTLLDDFDIYKEAGSFHLMKKTFSHLKPTAQGKLNISFEPIKNYATVTAIEVIDESN